MMSPTGKCPECGKELPANAPRGQCPACLLKRGLESNTLTNSNWTPPSLEELTTRFPELHILRMIGRGGMGAVYQARQKNLDRMVALKILPPEIGADPAFADRFAREAQAMARLNHPHIVTIHEFGKVAAASSPLAAPSASSSSQNSSGGDSAAPVLYYLLMEYVDGVNLRTLLEAGHISPKEALAIVPQICEALQFAHDQGIVHRDIKPENILLNKQGQVKIADFGLAKLMGLQDKFASNLQSPVSNSQFSVSHSVLGTPAYMAPEQKDRPAEVDHRADIYSLGVVFYQMLTGELPRSGLEPPSRKVQIDVRLDEIVLRALEADPERRYQQASEVKTRVEAFSQTSSHSADTQAKQPWGARGIDVDPDWSDRLWLRWKRRLPLAGLRNGKATIYWPGLLAWSGLQIVIGLTVFLVTASIFGANLELAALSALVLSGGIMAYRLRQWLRLPPERLMPLDGSTATGGGNRSSAATIGPRRIAMRMVLIGGVILLLLLLSLFGVGIWAQWQAIYRPAAPRASAQAGPSRFPEVASGRIAFLVHDRVNLHYALLSPDEFDSTEAAGSHNTHSLTWIDKGSLKLKNGRTFGYLRESVDEFHLSINGQEFDLRQGRVLVLHDDGRMEQVKVFPPLAVASDAAALKRLIAQERSFREGPEDLAKLQGRLAIAQSQLQDLLKTHAPTHTLVLATQDSIAALQERIRMFTPATDDSPALDSLPPVVLTTDPISGTRGVVPGTRELRVTFSKPMVRDSYSWSTAWENSTPQVVEVCRFEPDGRTAILKVNLEPGQTYAYWLNSNDFHNFKDTTGLPAVPYLLIFETAKE